MSADASQSPLMQFLQTEDSIYHAKVLELREVVQGWLSYIPQTFPHYTRHTVDHSDEIVLQVSKLLFTGGDPHEPTVRLSALEAYVLAAAAYLHDTGMVASDREKTEILTSDEWRSWTTSGAGANRWREVEVLRQSQEPADEAVRSFLADLQTRYLIAEFVRRAHHERATHLILSNQSSLGRFALDDRVLLRTISDVCAAHGLRQHELEDRQRYPDRRDIRGRIINVKFVALLLRLGDLLDMRTDRACPLLMNAACPLPSDSLAHWTQYQRITHRLTAPDKIEITAECQTQDEHRVLQDWCQWLASEVRGADRLMAHSARHSDWRPPLLELEGSSPTITIRPAPDAAYVWSTWQLKLDSQIIFERLIHDVSSHPAVFIRELLQNALDASRCQMYADMQGEGTQPPEYPTQVEADRRERYPVHVALTVKELPNALSGEVETRQVLSVDDCGIGMDNHVIEHYFLQIGRSYYTSQEFREAFGFVPTSRFGLGFLSVFAVSDHVVVETCKQLPPGDGSPIRLTLTGPRNYLLTERGSRRTPGTRVEVLLRAPIDPGQLTEWVSRWCKRVEFPVHVDDLGARTAVVAERAEQYICEVPLVAGEGKLAVRAFPIERPGIEGELYVLAKDDTRGQSWAAWRWAQYTYTQQHPQAVVPQLPGDLVCLHGIAVTEPGYSSEPFCARLDFRGAPHRPTLSRDDRVSLSRGRESDPQVVSRWEEILRQHLATSPRANAEDAWRYKQALVDQFPFADFWRSVPRTLRVYVDGQPQLVSLEELQAEQTIISIAERWQPRGPRVSPAGSDRSCTTHLLSNADVPLITRDDLKRVSDAHLAAVFRQRQPVHVRWLPGNEIAIDWETCEHAPQPFADLSRPLALVPLPDDEAIGCAIHRTTHSVYECLLLNEPHPFVQWLCSVKEACARSVHGLEEYQFRRLISLLLDPLSHGGYELPRLQAYLNAWRELPGLPSDLYPPDIELREDMFSLRGPQA